MLGEEVSMPNCNVHFCQGVPIRTCVPSKILMSWHYRTFSVAWSYMLNFDSKVFGVFNMIERNY